VFVSYGRILNIGWR